MKIIRAASVFVLIAFCCTTLKPVDKFTIWMENLAAAAAVGGTAGCGTLYFMNNFSQDRYDRYGYREDNSAATAVTVGCAAALIALLALAPRLSRADKINVTQHALDDVMAQLAKMETDELATSEFNQPDLLAAYVNKTFARKTTAVWDGVIDTAFGAAKDRVELYLKYLDETIKPLIDTIKQDQALECFKVALTELDPLVATMKSRLTNNLQKIDQMDKMTRAETLIRGVVAIDAFCCKSVTVAADVVTIARVMFDNMWPLVSARKYVQDLSAHLSSAQKMIRDVLAITVGDSRWDAVNAQCKVLQDECVALLKKIEEVAEIIVNDPNYYSQRLAFEKNEREVHEKDWHRKEEAWIKKEKDWKNKELLLRDELSSLRIDALEKNSSLLLANQRRQDRRNSDELFPPLRRYAYDRYR